MTINDYDCRVSDRGLKFCEAISGRAIFLYQLFLFCIKTLKHHQVTKAVSSTHFWVFVKIASINLPPKASTPLNVYLYIHLSIYLYVSIFPRICRNKRVPVNHLPDTLFIWESLFCQFGQLLGNLENLDCQHH
jgi:hypothetical protein